MIYVRRCDNLTRSNIIVVIFQMQWRVLMKADKAVKQSHLSGEYHAKYMMSRREGATPNYDMLV